VLQQNNYKETLNNNKCVKRKISFYPSNARRALNGKRRNRPIAFGQLRKLVIFNQKPRIF
jgi:hypothetical protein